MKDSGIEWIGKIPEDWRTPKLKNCTKISSGEYVSSNQYINNGEFKIIGSNGEIGRINEYNNILPVITTGRVGTIGTVRIIEKAWITDNVLIINNNHLILIKYLYYIMPNLEFDLISSGTAQPLITATNLKNQKIPLPPKKHQKKIANFLDQKTSKIDHIIEEAKLSIEEYKNYKQSLITETVTKGLNKDVPMKDSGVEWIGEIPSHWTLPKIKHTSWLKGRIGWQGLKASEHIDEGPYLITGTDFNKGIIDWNTCAHISEDRFNEAPDIHIKENDLLITKDGTIGKVAIALNCPEKVSLNSGVMLIRNLQKIKYLDLFLYYVLLSDEFWQWFYLNQTGNSTILHLYQGEFYNFMYALPSEKEQKEIVRFLDKKTSEIDSIIAQKEKLVKELESYKKSLIFECVTGKREVN